MFFSLEVLQAQFGDCLLLHYGDKDKPQLIVIDGGPSGIYQKYLEPRLLELKSKRTPDNPLPISMVMISHADDDHINGIVKMTNDMIKDKDDQKPLQYAIKNVWFNAFDNIIGNIEILKTVVVSGDATTASLQLSTIPTLKDADEHVLAVIASAGQGVTIRSNCDKLDLNLNNQFQPLQGSQLPLVHGNAGDKAIKFGDLSIKVIHPNRQRLVELQAKWDKDLKAALDAKNKKKIHASLTSLDKSPYNLSSIVCLVKLGGKTILLTGDGRSDDIYKGLEMNGLLNDKGKIHVDILKMPHHGSKANMHAKFLRAVTADYYVISADGKHDNPDQETLDMISENISSGTLFFTNHSGEKDLKKKMDDFVIKLAEQGSELKVVFREEASDSMVIDLLDKINF